jgi:hypothetical protein
MNIKDLAGIPVVGKPHYGLNQSKGILFDRDHDLDGIPEGEIKKELAPQGVISVKRFTKKRNEIIEPTNTYLLSFAMPTLPKNIKVGFYQMKVEMFVPNPLRCFKCQRFGHGQTNCKGSETCFRCGEEGHDGKNCNREHKCRNCKGDHMASSKKCPIWIKEKEIQKVKIEKRVTYPEAKNLVNMYNVPKPNLPSYSTVLKSSSMKDMSTQVCGNDISTQTSVGAVALSSCKNTNLTPGTGSAESRVAPAVPESSVSAKPAVADAHQPRRRNTSPDVSKQPKRHNPSPKGKPNSIAIGCPRGRKIRSLYIINMERWRTWSALHHPPPHELGVFLLKSTKGGYPPYHIRNNNAPIQNRSMELSRF